MAMLNIKVKYFASALRLLPASAWAGRMTARQRRTLRFCATCGLSIASLAFVLMFTRILLQWTT